MKKEKFEIRILGELVEVDASVFHVFGYQEFIVHRDKQYPKTWTVSEPFTGFGVMEQQKTRAGAIEATTKYLCSSGDWTPEQWFESRPDWFKQIVQCGWEHTDYYLKEKAEQENK